MMNRRHFFGTLAGSAALASVPLLTTAEPFVKGWVIRWNGWREPENQLVRVGVWSAVRDPMPETLPEYAYPIIYSTTLGVVRGCFECQMIDFSREDMSAPVSIHEPEIRFTAAKAWALQRLVKALESL